MNERCGCSARLTEPTFFECGQVLRCAKFTKHGDVDFSSGGSLASTESPFASQSHETLRGKEGERIQHASQHVDEVLWMSVKLIQQECAQFCVFRAQDDVVLLRHLDRPLRGSVLMLRWSDEERLSPSESRTERNTLEGNFDAIWPRPRVSCVVGPLGRSLEHLLSVYSNDFRRRSLWRRWFALCLCNVIFARL